MQRRSVKHSDVVAKLSADLRDAEEAHKYLRASVGAAGKAGEEGASVRDSVTREKLSAAERAVGTLTQQRDEAVRALETTRQHLLTTSSALDQLRVEYEGLLGRHQRLQAKMEQLVALSGGK